MSKLLIGEVASLLGLTPKAIRHYHQIGLLAEPERGANGYRLYGVADLRQLQTIQRLQGLGLSLKQIQFILDADDPDTLLRHLLIQRDSQISNEIADLRTQQQRIQTFLREGTSVQPGPSSMTTVYDVVRPVSNGLADIIVAVEAETLHELDGYDWPDGYEVFWEQAALWLAAHLRQHEHPFILWMERYLALAEMAPDDRQAQAWLDELRTNPARMLLVGALSFPQMEHLSPTEQARIQHLIPLLLTDDASPWQRAFMAALVE